MPSPHAYLGITLPLYGGVRRIRKPPPLPMSPMIIISALIAAESYGCHDRIALRRCIDLRQLDRRAGREGPTRKNVLTGKPRSLCAAFHLLAAMRFNCNATFGDPRGAFHQSFISPRYISLSLKGNRTASGWQRRDRPLEPVAPSRVDCLNLRTLHAGKIDSYIKTHK